jgi:hypothetical protein
MMNVYLLAAGLLLLWISWKLKLNLSRFAEPGKKTFPLFSQRGILFSLTLLFLKLLPMYAGLLMIFWGAGM